MPKGFFPQQDTGRINGAIQADQSISFQLMRQKLQQFIAIIQKDPAVDTVVGFTGGGQTNGGFVFMSLKPMSERKISADQVIRRLRGQLAQVAGATLFLQAVQDIRVGGRAANAQYQYTLQADTVDELYTWAPKILAELQKVPQLTDVNSDQQNRGLETDITIDRETAARLGITVAQIDNTLYDAFGQRQVSTIYNARNQYHVIMEVAPKYWQNPEALKDVYVSTSGGSVGGVQATNAVAGTVSGAKRDGEEFGRRGGRGRRPQSRAQFDRQYRQGRRIDRGGGEHQRRKHGAVERGHPISDRATFRSPSITRACSSPPPSRSISPPAHRSAMRSRWSTRS